MSIHLPTRWHFALDNIAWQSLAAMQEGVRNSAVMIAIITPACVNPDKPHDDPGSNAYFARDYCVKELRWAREAGVPIQPVIRSEDKKK
jgi:hypothetical protein